MAQELCVMNASKIKIEHHTAEEKNTQVTSETTAFQFILESSLDKTENGNDK